jgi:hypothetical protein
MKRYLIAAMAALTLLAIPATASASTGGAARAVEREVEFDYSPDYAYAWCKQAGFHRYTCQIRASMYHGDDNHHGAARVTQVGRHYRVSYRIY